MFPSVKKHHDTVGQSSCEGSVKKTVSVSCLLRLENSNGDVNKCRCTDTVHRYCTCTHIQLYRAATIIKADWQKINLPAVFH